MDQSKICEKLFESLKLTVFCEYFNAADDFVGVPGAVGPSGIEGRPGKKGKVAKWHVPLPAALVALIISKLDIFADKVGSGKVDTNVLQCTVYCSLYTAYTELQEKCMYTGPARGGSRGTLYPAPGLGGPEEFRFRR